MQLVELVSRIGESQVRDILELAVGYPTPKKMSAVVADYESTPERFFLGFLEDTEVIGVICGFHQAEAGAATILHIAVRPDRQGRGIGSALIDELRNRFCVSELAAETDRDAVAFYERYGFEVQSPGERYPWTERFRCRWRPEEPGNSSTPSQRAKT